MTQYELIGDSKVLNQMDKGVVFQFQNIERKIFLLFAICSVIVLAVINIYVLNQYRSSPEPQQIYLGLIGFLFMMPTLFSWLAFRRNGAIFFFIAGIFFSILTFSLTSNVYFMVFALGQIILFALLMYYDRLRETEMIADEIEIEKAINERNDLELSYKEKGTSISVSFEKYASYYNLRNIANEFSTSLSLSELSDIIVSRTIELIQRGNWCFLFLADAENENLSLISAKSPAGDKKMKAKMGDIFDYWILRNKQSLLISDTVKDFRFDMKKASSLENVRSVIASPLLHEGKVVGTLRVNAREPETFATDDLRLLDAVSMLASSAISNSILFRKTEELAIRDSLTNLYVHRHFLERLADEHKRSLLTNAPMTLLMCDLDHFKKCNDKYGHGIGDFILIKTAELLAKEASHAIVARYGGEEFAILLPKVGIKEGLALAESIREKVSKLEISVRREFIPITVSIGVASIPDDTLDSEELIQIADKRLYQAKKQGRNKVC
ncbi:MAG: hypothetical protein A3G33_03375 [Omnitrophica bacterium RIFCSPLOWO2_12_FULL_44_17]|uniref:diguanylate cyclase n=1 Tax=Candidatus Danuiimicrobium aquiferis TaxID=1801832 RepID=A0A1G1KTU9_9BACT|nr:MAG: hypothetical protein A3B72_06920 [Omnitrophica bacterium RIFCSPHIGHO2_02_FULL_45_28]OGW90184.1 MAG: hypothetical protein A3E74_06400 [Omnitrophica bacterium RIFCSPHIGHO2_12_FULL_44_12]OGW96358.1 MAG: hypothetical protein A3G33_03375 [Omnitrophica bacterium RIFCSPLOWO2_12_FULL_44_17]OGX04833.1 MAG: hypothetical protein A3J12_07755 [Omnitrophica bacterium RIFCSPLOWO2_02_FULL_44_11]